MMKCSTPPSSSTWSFSVQTRYHTTLYVPVDCWDAYAYDDVWYSFINIRETATARAELSASMAYTLMDAKAFTYAVYDEVNDAVRMVSSAAVDESDPKHCWQTVKVGNEQYLYNIGARKFAVPATDGRSFALSETVGNIRMEDGADGIVIEGHNEQQWALVNNERMSADMTLEGTLTGIKNLSPTLSQGEGESIVSDLSGRRTDKMQRGINIVRMSDGTVKKVMVK